MATISPIGGETPLDFVQRADSLKAPDEVINRVLTDHFGYADHGEIKKLKLQSKPYWDQFFRVRVEGNFKEVALNMLHRGSSRERTIMRKSIESYLNLRLNKF